MHFQYLLLAVLFLAMLIFCGWLAFYTSRAITVLSGFPLVEYFVAFPPRHNRFHYWYMRIFGVIGMLFFGLLCAGMLTQLF